ncbi:hypothetical protein [Vibrio caribbeanicus]|uniref:hypothetical protein n=1 Tax=Vibrio caribbeanicus TaxID=701175 RepID=UPI002283AB27|nr:hypothetical protein [Vibrio caribbeanicus]MCY9844592.1 hypothetical protein [Vibrio caribbeanicus]
MTRVSLSESSTIQPSQGDYLGASSTAIPVFAVSEFDSLFLHVNECVELSDRNVILLNSWSDYQALKNRTENESSYTISKADKMRDECVRVYFENGGGRCYLIKLIHFEREVPFLRDATLLVQAGQPADLFQKVVVKLCTKQSSLFAICDGPCGSIDSDNSWKNDYCASTNTAIYYPWLKQKKGTDNFLIPPSAAIAGAYCLNDSTRGVWQGPTSLILRSGLVPACELSEDTLDDIVHGDLVMNTIREISNGSSVIWGAKTAGQANEPQWCDIATRRLFFCVKRAIKNLLSPFESAPHCAETLEKIYNTVSEYLKVLWQKGALYGAKQEEAFFVKLEKYNNPTRDKQHKLSGNQHLNIHIGMAVTAPDEFLSFDLTQSLI